MSDATSARRQRFLVWLSGQRDRGDVVGNLARDMRRDACVPHGEYATLANLRDHLRYVHGLSDAAVSALESAWREHGAES